MSIVRSSCYSSNHSGFGYMFYKHSSECAPDKKLNSIRSCKKHNYVLQFSIYTRGLRCSEIALTWLRCQMNRHLDERGRQKRAQMNL